VGFLLWASWVFLCILPVYLGALFAFLIKFSYLSKNKKKACENHMQLKKIIIIKCVSHILRDTCHF